MTIDVSQLLRKKTASQLIDLTLKPEEIFGASKDIKVKSPVTLKGEVVLVGDILHLDVQVITELLLQCSRCVEDFTYTIELSIHEEFSNNRDNEDENIIFIESDNIDITEVIESNILLSLPIKILCDEDCKGLCQKCGKNLNISSCNCNDEDVDPRLSKLKDLFLAD